MGQAKRRGTPEERQAEAMHFQEIIRHNYAKLPEEAKNFIARNGYKRSVQIFRRVGFLGKLTKPE